MRILLRCAACAGENRRGKLINWVEKASFEKNLEVVGDFRAGGTSQSPSYFEESG